MLEWVLTTESMPEVVGKYSLGETNEPGLNLLQFCSLNKYVLTNTILNKYLTCYLYPK